MYKVSSLLPFNEKRIAIKNVNTPKRKRKRKRKKLIDEKEKKKCSDFGNMMIN